LHIVGPNRVSVRDFETAPATVIPRKISALCLAWDWAVPQDPPQALGSPRP